MQEGYKYLFSDITHNWNDAIAECQLYGGWLVDVTGVEEHNCILRFGKSQGFNTWYWIDGKNGSYSTYVSIQY